jgi:hypothetical protein
MIEAHKNILLEKTIPTEISVGSSEGIVLLHSEVDNTTCSTTSTQISRRNRRGSCPWNLSWVDVSGTQEPLGLRRKLGLTFQS